MALITPVTLVQDAKNRALRTFLAGLAFDVIGALILLLFPVFTKAQNWGDFDWALIGFLVMKTVVITTFSYIMRRYLDGSSIPTPLPPAPVPEPNDDAPAAAGDGDTDEAETMRMLLLQSPDDDPGAHVPEDAADDWMPEGYNPVEDNSPVTEREDGAGA